VDLTSALGLIAEVPDFPQPGVRYRDITPLLADADGFATVVDALAKTLPPDVDLVAGLEARGFLFAAAVGYADGIGMVAIRKPGKLPSVAGAVSYALEYGTATLELPANTVRAGQRVAIIDDVLATGGTVAAAAELIERAGAEVVAVSVVLELADLGGRKVLAGHHPQALQTL
jgi:adenine phosphoribosyltransferase